LTACWMLENFWPLPTVRAPEGALVLLVATAKAAKPRSVLRMYIAVVIAYVGRNGMIAVASTASDEQGSQPGVQ
jgi:hypothetical protein